MLYNKHLKPEPEGVISDLIHNMVPSADFWLSRPSLTSRVLVKEADIWEESCSLIMLMWTPYEQVSFDQQFKGSVSESLQEIVNWM